MSTELVRRDQDAFELGKVFKASGMFPTMKHEAEAVVKIIAGREFGLGPLASMNGIHMVDGKPTLAANLIAGAIKRHPHYDYRVVRREDSGCTLEFFAIEPRRNQPSERVSLGQMTWDKRDATAAGLLGKTNWKKYPRDMYFARCLTSGARTFCPDVLGGSPVYTAEELGAEDQGPQTGAGGLTEQRDEVLAAAAPTTLIPDPVVVEAGVDIPDAEVVADEPAKVGTSFLDYLRDTFIASGKTQDDLAWMLLSVGVESLPESPSKDDIGVAMRGLTVDQAKRLDALFQDDAVPGSGETT